jgi:hypothetical protein
MDIEEHERLQQEFRSQFLPNLDLTEYLTGEHPSFEEQLQVRRDFLRKFATQKRPVHIEVPNHYSRYIRREVYLDSEQKNINLTQHKATHTNHTNASATPAQTSSTHTLNRPVPPTTTNLASERTKIAGDSDQYQIEQYNVGSPYRLSRPAALTNASNGHHQSGTAIQEQHVLLSDGYSGIQSTSPHTVYSRPPQDPRMVSISSHAIHPENGNGMRPGSHNSGMNISTNKSQNQSSYPSASYLAQPPQPRLSYSAGAGSLPNSSSQMYSFQSTATNGNGGYMHRYGSDDTNSSMSQQFNKYNHHPGYYNEQQQPLVQQQMHMQTYYQPNGQGSYPGYVEHVTQNQQHHHQYQQQLQLQQQQQQIQSQHQQQDQQQDQHQRQDQQQDQHQRQDQQQDQQPHQQQLQESTILTRVQSEGFPVTVVPPNNEQPRFSGYSPQSESKTAIKSSSSGSRPYTSTSAPTVSSKWQGGGTNLLDFKTSLSNLDHIKLMDRNRRDIVIDFLASLDGKFYINDKYMNIDTNDQQVPIICYRRNFNSLLMALNLSEEPTYLEMDGKSHDVENLRLSLNCVSNFSDAPVEISYFSGKLNSKLDDILDMENPEMSVGLLKGQQRIRVKRFQFTKATPNNGKSIAKDYYYLQIHLSADVKETSTTDADDYETSAKRKLPFNVTLMTLKTNGISVRGRNPSFYTEREDISIGKENSQCYELFHQD